MSIATGVSLEEYLNTSYEPDCDYVDGVLEDRNVGKRRHSRTLGALVAFFCEFGKELGIEVLPAMRMRVSASRVRIPDVAIVAADDADEVIQRPPLLCIEILSPGDRKSRLLKCLSDYLAFGVPMIWIIDPYDREAFVVTQENPKPQLCDPLVWNGVTVSLSDILPDEVG